MADCIERHKQDRAALVSELETAGAVFKNGRDCTCPFHDDNHPSAGIFKDESDVWRFKCQTATCGFGGDVFDVMAHVQGRPVSEVMREYRQKHGGPADKGDRGRKAANTQKQQKPKKVYPDLTALRAGELRGPVTAAYYYPDRNPETCTHVVFRLDTPKGKMYPQAHKEETGWTLSAPPAPRAIYNRAAVIAATGPIILVEGEKTADALIDVGFVATTTPGGAGKSHCCDLSPLAGKTVINWPDPDVDGRKHGEQVKDAALALGAAVSMIEPNNLDLSGKEDAFDFIEQCRTAGMDDNAVRAQIQKALDGAERVRASGGLLTFFGDVAAGRLEYVPMPFGTLAKLSKAFQPRTVCLVCGTPGSGKSFFLLQLLLHLLGESVPFACYMLEEDKVHHLQRAIALLEDEPDFIDLDWIHSHHEEAAAAYERHAATLDKLGSRLSAIPDAQENYKGLVKWIEGHAQSGCKLIAVDPITACEQVAEPWIADTKFLMDARRIAVNYNTTILIVTHPKKGMAAPGLDDLAGGAAWQRFSQSILWIEHHKKAKKVKCRCEMGSFDTEINRTVHVCKGRNAPGVGSCIGFRFGGETLLFAEQGIVLKENKDKKTPSTDDGADI